MFPHFSLPLYSRKISEGHKIWYISSQKNVQSFPLRTSLSNVTDILKNLKWLLSYCLWYNNAYNIRSFCGGLCSFWTIWWNSKATGLMWTSHVFSCHAERPWWSRRGRRAQTSNRDALVPPPTPSPNVHSLYMWVDCLTVNLGLHSLCPPTSWEVLNPRSQAFIWRRTILSYSLLWELDFEILWVIFREYWDPKLCIKAWSCYAILNSLFLNKWYLVKSQLWQ